MSLSPFQVLCATLGAILLLAGGLVWISLSLHEERLRTLEARNREQALTLQAAQAAHLLLWTRFPDGSLHASPSPLLAQPGALLTLEDLLAQVPANSRPILQQNLVMATAGESPLPPLRLPFQAPDGNTRITLWTLSHREGLLQGVVQDITAEALLQEQLIGSQRREAVATLVSGISHEFGNILGAVDSCAGALLAQPLEPEARQAGELIQESAQRGKAVIRQLLDLGRPRAPETQDVEVNALIRELARLLEPLFPKRIHLQLDLAESIPTLRLDRGQLHQALLNLCLNARDAMPQGGTLTLRSRTHGETISLEVQDTGHGMDEATLSRMFEPFFTTKEPGQGTGLGLALTRDLVEGLAGSLSFQSRVGAGTSFAIRLPLDRPFIHP